jgi:hypothetical protein
LRLKIYPLSPSKYFLNLLKSVFLAHEAVLGREQEVVERLGRGEGRQDRLQKQTNGQRDQIGRNFAIWAIFLGVGRIFFKKKSPKIRLNKLFKAFRDSEHSYSYTKNLQNVAFQDNRFRKKCGLTRGSGLARWRGVSRVRNGVKTA